MKFISENFFPNPKHFEGLWGSDKIWQEHGIEPLHSLTAQEDFAEVVDPLWAKDYPEWMDLYHVGMDLRQHVFDNYDVDPTKFHDWWGIVHNDVWDRDDYPNIPRENSDIHIDLFQDYSKVINIQIYMSEDIPPEAGTCFWKYKGKENIDHSGPWPQEKEDWELTSQLPFEYNTAFSYDAGPNGVFHSAPLTNDLLDLGVPNHVRRVIIMRYRFK